MSATNCMADFFTASESKVFTHNSRNWNVEQPKTHKVEKSTLPHETAQKECYWVAR